MMLAAWLAAGAAVGAGVALAWPHIARTVLGPLEKWRLDALVKTLALAALPSPLTHLMGWFA